MASTIDEHAQSDISADVFAEGKAIRLAVSRSTHSGWDAAVDRADPIALLEESSVGRLPSLIPIRYGRMSASPFTFFRGAAIIMASDLGTSTPNTGIFAQVCGDCHLENFGVFATPERNIIFDINDFDETLPAPWEWDVKRLTASIHIAGRVIGLAEKQCMKAVLTAVRGYREQIRLCAGMTALEVWYSRVDAHVVAQQISDAALRRAAVKNGKTAPAYTHEMVADEYTEGVGKDRFIADKPPNLFHPPADNEVIVDAQQVMKRYRETLREDIAHLVGRYHLADLAVKVVGMGSIGTRCAVALLMAKNDDALLLQIKEARPSVLEDYAGKSRYADHGQRVVAGQRLMQAASDMFLGWTFSADGHQFYVRQLSDMKGSVQITAMSADDLTVYAKLCATVLAIAHARSADAAKIGGYVGTSETFDDAIAAFAAAYADQNDRDYHKFLKAIKTGRLEAKEG